MEKELDRRDFLKSAAGASAALAFAATAAPLFADAPAKATAPIEKTISMVKLPYAENALEPYISARTVNLHYNRHHMSYFNTLKGWIASHPEYQNKTLEELILINKGGILLDESIFDVSVLLFNHNWYWQSLKSNGGGAPKGKMEKMIVDSFGSYDAFHTAFMTEAMKLGIGWVWVVEDKGKVKVNRSEYLDSPIVKGLRPLLAIDVWEHAYYLDYQNDRQKYIETVLKNLINWDFAEQNLDVKK